MTTDRPGELSNRAINAAIAEKRRRYIDAALRDEVRRVAEAGPGTRNTSLNTAAFNLASLGVAEQRIRAELMAAAGRCGLIRDDGAKAVRATIASGMEAGYAKPRRTPQTLNGCSAAGIAARPSARPSAPRSPSKPAAHPDMPSRTPPDVRGKPAFMVAGDEGPPRKADEIRRHFYCRDGVPVRIKIKYRDHTSGKSLFANWYRVIDGGTLGWQAGKPDAYMDVPYVTFGANPFDPEARSDVLYWPEGEKDVDAITKLGGLAFTFGGTGDGLPASAVEYVRGRDVVIVADNDRGGQQHAHRKAALAHPVATSVKVMEFSELPEKGDVSDWIAQGRTAEELTARVHATPLWSPVSESHSDAPGKTGRKQARRLVFGRLSEVTPLPVKWLWQDRIPRKFVLFTGPPDAGKTLTAIDIMARSTTAKAWPDSAGNAPLGSVIYVTAEDGIADTIRTRAEAAGADITRIHYLKFVLNEDGSRSTFSLQADLARLGDMIDEIGDVVLVVIDPVTAYLGAGKIDTHKTADVRAVLSPLTEFADERGITILGITHPPKSVANAMNAATGSLAFIAAARSAYLFTRECKDGEETGRTLMLPIKNNLGPRKAGLAFRILLSPPIAGEIAAPHIEWDRDPVAVTADEILATTELHRVGDRRALDEAKDFLRTELWNGEVETTVVEEQGRRAGIAKRTLARARKELQVRTRREGFGRKGKFYLSLPIECQKPHRMPD